MTTRRRFLSGAGLAGLAIALPPLEALVREPRNARAANAPEKLVLFHFPNGAYMPDWLPDGAGPSYELGYQLQPLAAHKDQFVLATGLSNLLTEGTCFASGTPHGAPNSVVCLGGVLGCDKTALDASIDHRVAELLPPALEPVLVTRVHNSTGSFLISYAGKGPGMAVSPVSRPSVLFDKLFAGGVDTAQLEYVRARRLSVLDFVRGNVAALQKKLGHGDQVRLELHLDAIRELELRADLAAASCDTPNAPPEDTSGDPPYTELPARAELLMDLSVLALRCGLTHVLNFSMGPSQSVADYPFLSEKTPPTNIHQISHWNPLHGWNDTAWWYREVTSWHVKMFGRLLEALAVDDGLDSTLLDRTALVAFSELSFGAWHSPYNLPVLLAGAGLGGGRHLHFPCVVEDPMYGTWNYKPAKEQCADASATPLANLWLTLLRLFGGSDEAYGQSTTTLDGLWT
jgi:hypothetical protein